MEGLYPPSWTNKGGYILLSILVEGRVLIFLVALCGYPCQKPLHATVAYFPYLWYILIFNFNPNIQFQFQLSTVDKVQSPVKFKELQVTKLTYQNALFTSTQSFIKAFFLIRWLNNFFCTFNSFCFQTALSAIVLSLQIPDKTYSFQLSIKFPSRL